ncbi:kinesin motor domain-containing protein [Cyclospora cayetanensis]|uniref:Kinesin-like protein n=1 Tax=Cyclospora cayetanensis TaxID=88456 RepID=A0A1D3D114_9EIME|nr:kinesin motor domain-containing protein [Cyclospora cayetanensis]
MASAMDESSGSGENRYVLPPGDITSASNIQIYLRMRPMVGSCKWHRVAGKDGRTFITNLPRDDEAPLNNSKAEYKFRFDGIFDQDATQEDVFQGAALPVVDDALRGINGTIFAYGQTGTGKTYTITGGAEAYELRGIIPRALARVFEFSSSCSTAEFSLAISYLEIYQDRGYDLLVKTETGSKNLEDLRRVYAVADDSDHVFLRGLSVNPIRTEEEALSLLFVGDANRIIAETPLNDCSTRSHCIFTIWIASKEHGGRSTKKAKLHLVDLAGSERVKQSGTRPGDCVFQEACSINLSLHYLEQVIVALRQKAAGQATHVPYRNSLMTSVLKDSLGGNCKTCMIATVALELYAINETISTCRFAQAVSQIKNVAAVNEEEETSALIERLQRENERLRGQLQLVAAVNEEQGELDEQAKDRCRDSVERFLRATGDDLDLPVSAARDLRLADFCFRILRDKFNKITHQGDEGRCRRRDCLEALQRLQLHVEQRDAEIALLLGIIHQSSESSARCQASDPLRAMTRAAVEAAVRGPQHDSTANAAGMPWLTGAEAIALLKNRGRAFEILRRSARKTEFLEADSQRLHNLYADAKKHGEAAVRAKEKIAKARTNLEKIRIRKCMQATGAPLLPEDDTPEETELLQEVASWRDEYIKNTDALGAAKRELKRVHMTIERSRQQLQEDFEDWFNVIASKYIERLGCSVQQEDCCKLGRAQNTDGTEGFNPCTSHQKHGHTVEDPYLGNFTTIAPPAITPLLTHSAGYPWVVDNTQNQRSTTPRMPSSTDRPSEHTSKEPLTATVIPSKVHSISQQSNSCTSVIPSDHPIHSCPNESPDYSDDDEPKVAPLPNPCPSVFGKNSLALNAAYSELSAVNCISPPNLSEVLQTRTHVAGVIYTGNPSADADIKAFYEAFRPGT